MTAETDLSPDDLADLWRGYVQAFGEPPPLFGWTGPRTALVELIGTAIRSGRSLDEEDVALAMGLVPAPPGALT